MPPEAIRVLFRSGVLLIAGEKATPDSHTAGSFHLVEREFGRFARAVRLNGAFDVQHSRATVDSGELKITLLKMAERRGSAQRIAVKGAARR